MKIERLTFLFHGLIAGNTPANRLAPAQTHIGGREFSEFSVFTALDPEDGESPPARQCGTKKVPFWDYNDEMRVIALRTLKAFIESRPEYGDAREPALAWYRQVLRADWASPNDVKRDVGNASILKDGRVVFNIAGNKYRVVVWVNYPYRVVYIRFVGMHAQYDRIDAQTI